MADKTKISWADATWNTQQGCTRCSRGCDHCYAERIYNRGRQHPVPWTANNAERVMTFFDDWDRPGRWRGRRMVFVNSMSDTFHESVSDQRLLKLWSVMRHHPQHTFLILTKRAKRMRVWLAEHTISPAPNVWVGVSVENQPAAKARLPHLVRTPAARRFVSAEPLLDYVDMRRWLDRIDWVIAGGESGPDCRVMDIRWAQSLRDQCVEARVAFYFKQFSGDYQATKPPPLDGVVWDQVPAVHELPSKPEQLSLF